MTPLSNGQAMGIVGVGVRVGSGVSVGMRVRVAVGVSDGATDVSVITGTCVLPAAAGMLHARIAKNKTRLVSNVGLFKILLLLTIITHHKRINDVLSIVHWFHVFKLREYQAMNLENQ